MYKDILVTLDATAADIRSSTGADVLPLTADLSVAADLDRLVEKIVAEFDGIDILVAICASPRRGSFDSLTDDDLKSAFEATVLPLARLVRLVLPHMQKNKWGRVVTVQSRSVREPIPDLTASNATLRAETTALAELGLEGRAIEAHAVCVDVLRALGELRAGR